MGGDTLKEISTQTGATMIRVQGACYITSGTKSQRDMTKLRIWSIVVSITLYTEVYSSVVMINSNSDLNVRVFWNNGLVQFFALCRLINKYNTILWVKLH